MKSRQLELFSPNRDQPHPPPNNARATKAAAQAAMRPHLGKLQAMVLRYIVGKGAEGTTDQECRRALGLSSDTQRPPRVELCKLRLVVDSGHVRATTSHRPAVAWRATEAGKQAVNARTTEADPPTAPPDDDGDFPW